MVVVLVGVAPVVVVVVVVMVVPILITIVFPSVVVMGPMVVIMLKVADIVPDTLHFHFLCQGFVLGHQ